MGWLKRKCFHGGVCELGEWRYELCQGAVPKNARYSCLGSIWRYFVVGFRRCIRRWGVPSYVPESVWWCFYGPLGWHTLCTSMPLVCRPCRASSRDISHGTHITAVRLHALSFMILCHIAYRTAGTAFFEKLFYGVLGCFAGLRFRGGAGCV